MWGTTVTRALLIALQFVPVIIAEFFSGLNITEGDNPDLALQDVRFTVRRTGVVDIPSPVLRGLAINVVMGVQEKDEGIPLCDAPRGLLGRNLLPEIRKNPCALGDSLRGEYAFSVDAGWANAEPNRHGRPPCILPER
jgi:hypothetical protein